MAIATVIESKVNDFLELVDNKKLIPSSLTNSVKVSSDLDIINTLTQIAFY